MDVFDAAIALVRHPEVLERRWLACRDESRQCLDFVTSPRLANESWRESLDREIAWTLRLRRGKDYLISSVARRHFEGVLHLPGRDAETKCVLEFYGADLYVRTARAAVEENPDLRWLSPDELLSGRTLDGEVVSPTLTVLLAKADVIAAHPAADD